jgi:hypothetical protein
MKRRKLLSLILALAMALALAVPAFASDGDTPDDDEPSTPAANTTNTSQNFSMTSSTNTGLINFSLPESGVVVLNPYQLKYTAGTDTTGTYHQVYSPAVSCTNKSTFPLSIEASLTGTVAEGVTLLTTGAPAATATAKQVFLYGEFGVSDSASVQPTWATAYNKSAANQVVVATAATEGGVAASKLNVAKLPAASATKPNYLWFKFDGAATKNPETAWLASDTVGVAIALTLHAVVSDVYAITVTNTTTTTAKGTATLNYDVAPVGEEILLTVTADEEVGGKATVTAKAGSASITFTAEPEDTATGCGVYKFKMPASAVAITVKWAAAS